MERIACPTCNALVSSDRIMCINCGTPVRTYQEALDNQETEETEAEETEETDE